MPSDQARAPSPTWPVTVWKVDLDACADQVEQHWAVLSADEQDRAGRYRFDQDRCRFIVCRAVLRAVLGRRLSVPAAAIQFQYSPAGKPFLAGPAGLEFNVSHSAGLALIAISRPGPVGVDLEQARSLEDGGRGIARYFSGRERSALAALAPDRYQEAFYRVWVRKEALLKALGRGIGAGLDRFSVAADPADDRVATQRFDHQLDGWRLPLLSVPGFAAAVATRSAGLAVQIQPWR